MLMYLAHQNFKTNRIGGIIINNISLWHVPEKNVLIGGDGSGGLLSARHQMWIGGNEMASLVAMILLIARFRLVEGIAGGGG